MPEGANWQIPNDTLAAAARALHDSRRPVVLTGAGISKESGIPTFREAQTGLWAQHDPADLATPRAFQRNPKRVWDWYQHRRTLLAKAEPNAGHHALADLERVLDRPLPVITQNIDGLHQRAGSSDVLPVHGDMTRNKCFDACQGEPTLIDVNALDWDPAEGPPRCPHCGAYVRPDVVWFEEMLPAKLLTRALNLIMSTDALLVVGTSGTVQPVASMPYRAREHGATVIEVNPDTTPISALAQLHLMGPAGAVLPQLVDALTNGAGADDEAE
jgi:NAD-dependent deacetylase